MKCFNDIRCRMAANLGSYLIIGVCFAVFLWMLFTRIDQ